MTELFLKDKDYIFIELVGNKYCKKRPSKNDKLIVLIDDLNNEFDSNAIVVYSLRKGKKIKLGFVSKNQTEMVKKYRNDLEFINIIVKNVNGENIYYLIYNKID